MYDTTEMTKLEPGKYIIKIMIDEKELSKEIEIVWENGKYKSREGYIEGFDKLFLEEIEKKNLTKKRVSEIIGCSLEYIEGLYENIYLEEKRKKEKFQ